MLYSGNNHQISDSVKIRKFLTLKYHCSTQQREELQRCFQNFSTKTFTAHAFTRRYKSLALSLGYICTFSETYTEIWVLSLSLQRRSIERAMDLTDSFTWEDLPTRDADTGHLTAAGWIPLIQLLGTRVFIVNFVTHGVLSTIRIVTNHETLFIAWYPFDWNVSPFYELVNISQVTICIS
jgi:hypothetical protein